MEFLNTGSTAEGSSTKRSSLSPVKPVGSGFSSPSRVSAPLVQGPVFSTDTDTDPNTSETRFVCFDLIPEQWTQESAEGCVLNRALEYTGLIGSIETAVGSPSEVPGFVNIFCRLGDERNARCRGRRRRRNTGFFESLIQEFRAGFLFGHVTSNAMLVAESSRTWIAVTSSLTPTKKFRAVFLFGSVARNAVPVGRVVENGSSEYLDFRSTEFTALSLFEDVISTVILDGLRSSVDERIQYPTARVSRTEKAAPSSLGGKNTN
ncbi:hypothetical protein D6D21_08372 [Aureobasidium pullulans]|uniref:Uncharacterized protein n=1 Tax=Aureobasidium pullulans TaxID=5580 RepID=A0AB74INN2_AURPU|nr:hypothetical protein D6D21_08372 [Aureobasidium pullulans]